MGINVPVQIVSREDSSQCLSVSRTSTDRIILSDYAYYILIGLCSLREVDQFKKVLLHPTFKKDPMLAISEHVRNSVSKGLS